MITTFRMLLTPTSQSYKCISPNGAVNTQDVKLKLSIALNTKTRSVSHET